MSGTNADSSKRTNIRLLDRLEKGSFVTFRIFVSALLKNVLFQMFRHREHNNSSDISSIEICVRFEASWN